MYFIIGLGEVSKECFETNSWLQYVLYLNNNYIYIV